jgi:putative membrane protein
LVNIFIRPLVIFFTLPLVIVTLGVAIFFVNLLMLYLTSWIVNDFTIDSFGWAILATIIVWVVNTVLEAIFGGDEGDRRGRQVTAREATY